MNSTEYLHLLFRTQFLLNAYQSDGWLTASLGTCLLNRVVFILALRA